ncbi:MAG: MgtC/SapB family protein [Thermoplasmata archaeon]
MELFGVELSPEMGILVKLTISIALGGLVGLEREYARREEVREFAGVRTFILIAMMGTISAMFGIGFFVTAFVAFSVLVALSYYTLSKRGSIGGTTEVATLITFIVGGLVYFEYLVVAATVAVVTTAFLSIKPTLHRFARGLSKEDVYATLKLAIVTIVILPILPNEAYDPLGVLNPFYIWLMVVFISCIGFAGYVAVKVLGGKKGVGLTGLLGGLVSSTAVALAFSQRSKENASLTRSFAIGITVASMMMFPRILFEVAVLNQSLFWLLLAPLLIMTLVGAAASAFLFLRGERKETGEVELKNPFSVMQALKFGLFFAIIFLAAKAAQVYFGDTGIYVASTLSGLTDVDAITLSMARLGGSSVSNLTASIAIVLAAISNTIVKGGLVAAFGSRQLSRYVILILSVVVAIGIASSAVLYALV